MDAWILVKRDEKPKAAWHWIISCFLVAYIIAMNSWLSHTFSVFMSVLFCYISMMESCLCICSVLDYCIKLALQLLEGCSFNRICPWFPTGELKEQKIWPIIKCQSFYYCGQSTQLHLCKRLHICEDFWLSRCFPRLFIALRVIMCISVQTIQIKKANLLELLEPKQLVQTGHC